jgi:GT2 family glycosyltransferase
MVDGQESSTQTVWIIVLHWQGSHYTRACLASLRSLTYTNLKVILVDNGSPDNSGGSIAQQFPEVELVETGKNLGFSGGCNAGIDYCLRKGAQWIWLLNNDTKVGTDSLSRLMEIADQAPRAGALGAMVVTGEGDLFAASGAGEIDFNRAKTFLRKTAPADSKFIECDWLSGSNLLLRAQALSDAGLFDDDYFLYFEDTELCWRMRKKGWLCLFVPSARVEHAGGGSTEGNRSYWRAYYYTRNRLLFFLNYSRGASRLFGLLNISGHLIRHALVLPFRGDRGKKQLKSELLGLKDYWDKRFGKAACLDWCE